MSDSLTLLITPQSYFKEVLVDACDKRKINPAPFTMSYLVDLLGSFLKSKSLFSVEADNGVRRRETLAELYLESQNVEAKKEKQRLLKRLGDVSLYVSGFFGDSLKKKAIDIDYYIQLGGVAYNHLAAIAPSDIEETYLDISNNFTGYVDVLTLVSQKAFTQSNKDVLRLYDKYLKTQSKLARDQLIEQGVFDPALIKKLAQ